jgi:hypothetical protein
MWAFYRLNVSLIVINVSKSQRSMQHVVYHNVQQKDFVQTNIWQHKGFVSYKKLHGTTTMSKNIFIE